MTKIVILIVIFISSASAYSINFADCANYEIKSVDLSACSPRCVIYKNADISFSIDFIAPQNCSKVELELMASMGELEVQVPGVDPDACDGHLNCPIAANTEYVIKYDMTVPKLIPQVEADIIGKIICVDNGSTLGCASVHVWMTD